MRDVLAACLFAGISALAIEAQAAPDAPHLLQQPALSHDVVAFSYAGDLWTAPTSGGRATRLTTGVGIESAPVFSPDGAMIAFTGDYDGNTDVFTIPVTGGVPKRITYHPAADSAVAWTPDGRNIIFRSDRTAASRYTQLFSVPAGGGVAKVLPLPMAYQGQLSPDGRAIAYTPLPPAFGFNFTSYTSWGNYRGGRAGTIWITDLQTLDSAQIPHDVAGEAAPVYADGKIYFLSGRTGPIGIYGYDPSSHAVTEVFHNTGPDIRSLSSDGHTLVFDRLGELYLLKPGEAPRPVKIDVTGDLPDVRPRILPVGDQVENLSVSPTGVRVAVEAHGEIMTVPVDKKGGARNITNTPGVMEREPAWSPNGQSLAYFSDEEGLYALHVADQTGARADGPKAVRKFKLAAEATYYFKPLWSPDSKKIAFFDNRLRTFILDTDTGKVTQIGAPDVWGGFTDQTHAMAWSPDSKWLAYPRYVENHAHVLMLYSLTSGASTQLTDRMADVRSPAFDRNGKYLYFTASNHAGAAQFTLDMSSDLYQPTRAIYALSLAGATASPAAPEALDEKSPAQARDKAKDGADETPGGQAGEAKAASKDQPGAQTKPPETKATVVDLAGLSVAAISERIAPLPLPERDYSDLKAGKPGTLYFLEGERTNRFDRSEATLSRYVVEDRKTEKLADRVAGFELTADGEKMLIGVLPARQGSEAPPPPGAPRRPTYAVVSAKTPVKAGEGAVSFAELQVRVDPAAEWRQMYHEVWRIERAFFYDAGFHGVDTVAMEKKLEPYVEAVQSRADLNYIFQEMLTGFSVGHLRGSGGAIPSARRVPGGLLGADYEIKGGRYCLSKIYTGGTWSPEVKAPLAQPGLNVRPGDCVLAIDGQALHGDQDIQSLLEGAAGRAVTLTLAKSSGAPREVTVIPVASEYALRNLDWIDGNRQKVSELSGGKLAYVYLPDTGAGGFTAFNRYYFAQGDKKGAVIDERFNGGGQVADYIVEVLGRKIESYWWARYGAPEHSPAAGVYGPKVMIANEVSGSGGDALPWLFKHAGLGPVVGKRTWGGLVGVSEIPPLMDGGAVSSPSVGFYSPKGEWDVENHGVEPDYPVEQDPKAVAAGHDPQLEAAVALAMSKLNDAGAEAPQRPPFPNYHRPSDH